MLTGDPDYSGGRAFDAWHRAQRGAGPAHSRSRALKSGFGPILLEPFHLRDAAALEQAVLEGAFAEMQPGRQPSGEPRRPKLRINLGPARRAGGPLVASRALASAF